MKKAMRRSFAGVVFVLGLLALGAFLAQGSEIREVKARGRGGVLAVMELARRGSELKAAREQLEANEKKLMADTAAVFSELAASNGLAPGETIVGCDEARGVFYVAAAPAQAAPIRTSTVGAGTR